MNQIILMVSILIIVAIAFSKLFYKIGTPSVVAFLGLGLLLGSDGLGLIHFSDIEATQNISTGALILIMFYGGFGVHLKESKPILKSAIILSSLGTIATALVVTFFSMIFLNFTFRNGLLLGSVIASTDAASVFAVLQAHKLNLKHNIGPLLEFESGSNDPFAYMLTIFAISLFDASSHVNIIVFMVQQIIIAILVAIGISYLLMKIFEKANLELDGLYSILILAITFLSYSMSSFLGGNGFLTVFLTGIIFNNSKRIPSKRSLLHFFDGLSWLMQILLFMTLGLLVNPSEFIKTLPIALILALFITFIARPLVVFILTSFSKFTLNDKLMISFAGIRGAASIVFATYARSIQDPFVNELLNIVFIVALLSVLLQGSFLPHVAKKLHLIDDQAIDVVQLSHYEDEEGAYLVEMTIEEGHPWYKHTLQTLILPEFTWIMMIKRMGRIIIPNGQTKLKKEDIVVIATNHEEIASTISKKASKWAN